jgi:hypothetical protein
VPIPFKGRKTEQRRVVKLLKPRAEISTGFRAINWPGRVITSIVANAGDSAAQSAKTGIRANVLRNPRQAG